MNNCRVHANIVCIPKLVSVVHYMVPHVMDDIVVVCVLNKIVPYDIHIYYRNMLNVLIIIKDFCPICGSRYGMGVHPGMHCCHLTTTTYAKLMEIY